MAAALAGLLLLSLAAIASAQTVVPLGSLPCPDGVDQFCHDAGVDPAIPPRVPLHPDLQDPNAKNLFWTYVGGRRTDGRDPAVTNGNECFRDVEFEDAENGFAVGYRVVDPAQADSPCAPDADGAQTPVLYRFEEDGWKEDTQAAGLFSSGEGYLAAVATYTRWTRTGKSTFTGELEAFAVGGTFDDDDPGTSAHYPRTEETHNIEDDPDPAGDRPIVLHYRHGQWDRLDDCPADPGGDPQGGACLPEGMGPLTAVAVAATAKSERSYDPASEDLQGTDDPAGLGVKKAEAFAFFGGASVKYGDPPDPPDPMTPPWYRGQVWQWHCLETRETPTPADPKNCLETRFGQVYDPDKGKGEGFEALAMSDPGDPDDPDMSNPVGRQWQVPSPFRVRDIGFVSDQRAAAYAVHAGCCSADHSEWENLSQIQYWEGTQSVATQKLTPTETISGAGPTLAPGHWWGSPHGGALANFYRDPDAPGETQVVKPGAATFGPGGNPGKVCDAYMTNVYPVLVNNGLPSPIDRRESDDACQNDRIAVPVGAPQVFVPSLTPTVYAVSIEGGVESGYAVTGPDGPQDATADLLPSYAVGRRGLTLSSAGRAVGDVNHLFAPRNGWFVGGFAAGAALNASGDNRFTEFLNGPMFRRGDRVWDVRTRPRCPSETDVGQSLSEPSWMVGAAGPGSDAGVLYETIDDGWGPLELPGTVRDTSGLTYEDANAVKGLHSIRFPQRFTTPVRALHAVEMFDGGGWAVGDDGALMRYTSPCATRQSAGGDTNIGRTERSDLPDRSGYDAYAQRRHGKLGTLPPLPLRGSKLPGGRRGFDVFNYPDEDKRYTSVALSADGTEGWAVGDDGALAHFDGRTWEPCPTSDSRCAVFAGRPKGQDAPGNDGTKEEHIDLTSIATVPGSGGFEAYAVGKRTDLVDIGPGVNFTDGPVEIYHLSGGTWTFVGSQARGREDARQLEPDDVPLPARTKDRRNRALHKVRLMKVIALAPDDVWIVGNFGPVGVTEEMPIVYHRDGQGWTECTDDGTRTAGGGEPPDPPPVIPGRCSDADLADISVLPRSAPETDKLTADRIAGAAAIDGRIYIGGYRRTEGSVRYPFVIYTGSLDSRDSAADPDNDPEPRLHWEHKESEGGFEKSGRYQGQDPENPHFDEEEDLHFKGEPAAFTMGRDAAGALSGWLIADPKQRFGPHGPQLPGSLFESNQMIRFDGQKWKFHTGPDLAMELMARPEASGGALGLDLTEPVSAASSALGGPLLSLKNSAPLMTFDGLSWKVLPSPLGDFSGDHDHPSDIEAVEAIGSDILGVTARGIFRYSQRPVRDPFATEPLPLKLEEESDIERNIYALDSAENGAVWMAGDSDVLGRRDPVAGWDTVRIKGWRPRGAALASVYDLAVGPDERGWAVGTGGRIAAIDSLGVRFDERASRLAETHLFGVDIAPDGSAMAAGDGVVLYAPAGGEWTLLDVPPITGAHRVTAVSMPKPDEAWLSTVDGRILHGTLSGGSWTFAVENKELATERINNVAIRADGTGYAVGADSLVLERKDGSWQKLPAPLGLRDLYALELAPSCPPAPAEEEGAERGREDAEDGEEKACNAGAKGEEGGEPDSTSAAGDDSDRGVVLIGSEWGDVLTLTDTGFQLARRGNPYTANNAYGRLKAPNRQVKFGRPGTPLRAMAMVRGAENGQLEVLAAQARELYRYTSDPEDPVIGRASRESLPDTPPFAAGDIPIATFGNSVCAREKVTCPVWSGLPIRHQITLRGILADIASRRARGGGPAFALFTGDVSNYVEDHASFMDFTDSVIDPLAVRGVPLFATPGRRDLVTTVPGHNDAFQDLPVSYPDPTPRLSGADLPTETWRRAFVSQPRSWGLAPRITAGDARGGGSPSPFSFDPVEKTEPSRSSLLNNCGTEPGTSIGDLTRGIDLDEQAVCVDEVDVLVPDELNPGDPDGEGPVPNPTSLVPEGPNKLKKVKIIGGGARTHYAFDVEDASGTQLMRVAVVNSSSGSTATNVEEHPVEPTSQLKWLDKALCQRGSASDQAEKNCTRNQQVPAVVLTNRPTATTDGGDDAVLREAAVFEQKLLDNNATLLVAGAIGANQKYWVTHAAGLHEPDSGYPDPDFVPEVARLVAVQSSAAGGKLETGTPDDGIWHGYSIVHVNAVPHEDATGTLIGGVPPLPEDVPVPDQAKPVKDEFERARGCVNSNKVEDYAAGKKCEGGTKQTNVYVENRPIVENVFLTAKSHVLRAGQNLVAARGQIQGVAVTPVSADEAPQHMPIGSAAITHRYDLIKADPNNPSQPLLDGNGNYQQFDTTVAKSAAAAAGDATGNRSLRAEPGASERIATIDMKTGDIKTSRKGPSRREWALVLLSVGNRTGSFPIAFDPRKSFIPKPPRAERIPAPLPQVRAAAAGTPPPPPATPTSLPKIGQLETPKLPNLTFQAPPAAQPKPAPPPPPAPPIAPFAAPLEISPAPTSVTVAPPTSVIPPPAPPIQPAPPGGARREARQRQAATAKSESTGDGAEEAGGDTADGPDSPPGSAMTRIDRVKPGGSFTAVSNREQPSAWARGALYGGGLTLMALVLSTGWLIGRPTPRRRTPELPAPAWSRNEFRRRR